MSGKIGLCAIVRWEADHFAEWLDYHHDLGIERFFIYINDDSEADILQAVQRSSVPAACLTFYHVRTIGLQRQSYCHFIENHCMECEWFIFLDADEFVALPQHTNLRSLLEGLPSDVGAYSLYWVMFGPNGAAKRTQGSVLQTYTKRSRYPNWHCKSFTRSQAIAQVSLRSVRTIPFWHSWGDRLPEKYQSIDVLGHDMSNYWQEFPDFVAFRVTRPSAAQLILSRGFIAHYFMKSTDFDSFRFERGILRDFTSQAVWRQARAEGTLGNVIDAASEVEDIQVAHLRRHPTPLGLKRQLSLPCITPFYDGQERGRILAIDCTIIGDSTGPFGSSRADPCLFGQVQACAQAMPQGDRPYWTAVLREPSSLFGVAVFLAPDEEIIGPLLLCIFTPDNASPHLFEIEPNVTISFRSLVPFVWRNENKLVVTKVSILLLSEGMLPLDHVDLLSETDCTEIELG